jgi:hypothetical protein
MRILVFIFLILRTLWTLPTTMIGLVIGVLCTPFGARWQFVEGVVECHSGFLEKVLRRGTFLKGGASAITFGDCVLGRSREALRMTRVHERVHVRQAHRWGPFFVPAYLIASVIAKCQGKSAYMGNAFEVEAYAVSDGRERPLQFDGFEGGPFG